MNSVSWFDTPTKDLARAQKFYERVLNVKLQEQGDPGMKVAMFPGTPEDAGTIRNYNTWSARHYSLFSLSRP